MNTILIPTDFSPAAQNAMHYGAQLAERVNTSITLLHSYAAPVSMYGMTGIMNEIPIMTIPFEELKKSATSGLERCVQELQSKYPSIDIKTESRLGNAADDILELAEELKPFAIVVGSRNASGFERFVFGSTTNTLVRDTKYPVIAVPSEFENFQANTIVLATDFRALNLVPFIRIKELVSMLKAELHIVHVQTEREEQKQSLPELDALSPVYFTIQNENVKEGLLRYVNDVQAGMLMIFPHEHNFIDKLFFRLHAEDIISDANIPVICLPA